MRETHNGKMSLPLQEVKGFLGSPHTGLVPAHQAGRPRSLSAPLERSPPHLRLSR